MPSLRWRMLLLLLLLLSICCGQSDSSSSFRICPQKTYTIYEGFPVTMPCQAETALGSGHKLYLWHVQLTAGTSSAALPAGSRFNYSEQPPVGDLTIRAVDRLDINKTFYCTMIDSGSPTRCNVNPTLNVFWLDPNVTVVREQPAAGDVRLGDRVQLKCNFSASNVIIPVRWFLNGQIICTASDIDSCLELEDAEITNANVVINKFSVKHTGVYHCFVRTKHDSVLSVNPLPLLPDGLEKKFGNPVVYVDPDDDVGRLPVEMTPSITWSLLKKFGYSMKGDRLQFFDGQDSTSPRVINSKNTISVKQWRRIKTEMHFSYSGHTELPTRHFIVATIIVNDMSLPFLYEIVAYKSGSVDGSKNFEPPILNSAEQIVLLGTNYTQRVYLTHKGHRLSWRPHPRITWRGPDSLAITTRSPSARRRIERSGDLVLTSAQPGDSGPYTVTINNTFSAHQFKVTLRVVNSPQLIKKTRNVTIKDMRPAEVRCPYVPGQVAITRGTYFTWLRTGNETSAVASNDPRVLRFMRHSLDSQMSVSSSDGSLQLQRPSVQHSGTYHCGVSVQLSSGQLATAQSGKVILTVLKRLRVCPNLSRSQVFLERDVMNTINCGGGGGAAITRLWLFRRSPSQPFLPLTLSSDIEAGAGNSTLKFHLARSQHQGEYLIKAVDIATGERENRTIAVVVGTKPQVAAGPSSTLAAVGDAVRLNCSIAGSPRPSCSWQRRSAHAAQWLRVNTSSSSSSYRLRLDYSLLLRSAAEHHSGQYRCVAETQFHTVASAPISLTIGESPYPPRPRSSMARTIAIVVSCAVGYLGLIVFLSVCCALRMQRRKRKRGETQQVVEQQQQQLQLQRQQQHLHSVTNSPRAPFYNGTCKGSDISCYEPAGRSIPAEYKSLLSQGRDYTPPRQTADHLELQPNSQFDSRSLNSFSNSSFQSTNRLHTNTPANSVIESTLERVCRIHQKDRSRVKYRTGILGHGVFGIVRIGTLNNQPVVVKELSVDDPLRQNEFVEQMKMFAKCDHDYVTSLMGVCIDTLGRPLIILEYCDNGNLHELLGSRLRRKQALAEDCQLRMCLQVAQAVEHFHSLGFVHGDLGCRNILVTEELNLKLTNMGPGLDRFTGQYAQNAQGALMPIRWLPPEAVLHNQFGIKTDVWSFGVVVAEIFSHGRVPFSRLSDAEVLLRAQQQQQFRPELPDSLTPQLQSLVDRCWSSAPDRRPTASQIVGHIAELTRDLADV